VTSPRHPPEGSTPAEPQWQRVTDDVDRLDVPNGWLYRVYEWPREGPPRYRIAFVPEGLNVTAWKGEL
jgi:hypothetical protein